MKLKIKKYLKLILYYIINIMINQTSEDLENNIDEENDNIEENNIDEQHDIDEIINNIEENDIDKENDNIEENDIDEFIKILINNFPIENNAERTYYYFQIKEIDEVKINNCYIYCYNSSVDRSKFYFRLVIDLDKNINSKIKRYSSKYLMCQLLNEQIGTFDKKVLNYKTFMKNMTKKLIEIFDNLKFDKYYIKFSNKSDIKNDIKKVILEKKLFSNNCKININECSVCYDECSTSTYCDHPLCIPCLEKLNNNECPMCRKNLITYNTNYNDYDSNGEEEYD